MRKFFRKVTGTVRNIYEGFAKLLTSITLHVTRILTVAIHLILMLDVFKGIVHYINMPLNMIQQTLFIGTIIVKCILILLLIRINKEVH